MAKWPNFQNSNANWPLKYFLMMQYQHLFFIGRFRHKFTIPQLAQKYIGFYFFFNRIFKIPCQLVIEDYEIVWIGKDLGVYFKNELVILWPEAENSCPTLLYMNWFGTQLIKRETNGLHTLAPTFMPMALPILIYDS